jgi:hypothetical protein
MHPMKARANLASQLCMASRGRSHLSRGTRIPAITSRMLIVSALTDIENGPSFADELQCVPRNQPRPIEISAHCGQIALQVFIDAIVGCSLRDRRRDCRFLASDPVERAASSPFFRWMKKDPGSRGCPRVLSGTGIWLRARGFAGCCWSAGLSPNLHRQALECHLTESGSISQPPRFSPSSGYS